MMMPLISPGMLTVLYFTPKEVFGCRNRGYMALVLIGISMTYAAYSLIRAIQLKKQKDEEHLWWLITAAVLIVPLPFLILG